MRFFFGGSKVSNGGATYSGPGVPDRLIESSIDWSYLNWDLSADVEVGDLVSADAGGLPIYRVMAIRDGRAWLKDMQDGADRVSHLTEFNWKAPAH